MLATPTSLATSRAPRVSSDSSKMSFSVSDLGFVCKMVFNCYIPKNFVHFRSSWRVDTISSSVSPLILFTLIHEPRVNIEDLAAFPNGDQSPHLLQVSNLLLNSDLSYPQLLG